jgi:hypothetical protein
MFKRKLFLKRIEEKEVGGFFTVLQTVTGKPV